MGLGIKGGKRAEFRSGLRYRSEKYLLWLANAKYKQSNFALKKFLVFYG